METKFSDWDLNIIKKVANGACVYTVLQHVSNSGRSRIINVYLFENNEPIWIVPTVEKITGLKQDKRKDGLRISGCGMDMGFAIANEIFINCCRILNVSTDGKNTKQRWL